MTEKGKYLKKLKKELDTYTKKLSDIKEEFKGKTDENVEQISQSLQKILQEATLSYKKLEAASTDEWEPVKAITNEAFNHLRASFQDKVELSVDHITNYVGQIEDNCQENIEVIAKYVRKNPIKSIFIALGAGFILGKILK